MWLSEIIPLLGCAMVRKEHQWRQSELLFGHMTASRVTHQWCRAARHRSKPPSSYTYLILSCKFKPVNFSFLTNVEVTEIRWSQCIIKLKTGMPIAQARQTRRLVITWPRAKLFLWFLCWKILSDFCWTQASRIEFRACTRINLRK